MAPTDPNQTPVIEGPEAVESKGSSSTSNADAQRKEAIGVLDSLEKDASSNPDTPSKVDVAEAGKIEEARRLIGKYGMWKQEGINLGMPAAPKDPGHEPARWNFSTNEDYKAALFKHQQASREHSKATTYHQDAVKRATRERDVHFGFGATSDNSFLYDIANSLHGTTSPTAWRLKMDSFLKKENLTADRIDHFVAKYGKGETESDIQIMEFLTREYGHLVLKPNSKLWEILEKAKTDYLAKIAAHLHLFVTAYRNPAYDYIVCRVIELMKKNNMDKGPFANHLHNLEASHASLGQAEEKLATAESGKKQQILTDIGQITGVNVKYREPIKAIMEKAMKLTSYKDQLDIFETLFKHLSKIDERVFGKELLHGYLQALVKDIKAKAPGSPEERAKTVQRADQLLDDVCKWLGLSKTASYWT
jgi:hypothetical protein